MPRRPSKAVRLARAGEAFSRLIADAYIPVPGGWYECRFCQGLANDKSSAHLVGCPMLEGEHAYKRAFGDLPTRIESQVIFFRPEDADILRRNDSPLGAPEDHPACRCAQPRAEGE